MTINIETEKKILDLDRQFLTKNEIAELLHVSRRSVFNILKKYRVPAERKKVEKKNININDVISIHLLKNCSDIELLTKMFASTVCYKKIKKIIIPDRLFDVIEPKKIKKIVSITERAGYKVEVEFGRKFA